MGVDHQRVAFFLRRRRQHDPWDLPVPAVGDQEQVALLALGRHAGGRPRALGVHNHHWYLRHARHPELFDFEGQARAGGSYHRAHAGDRRADRSANRLALVLPLHGAAPELGQVFLHELEDGGRRRDGVSGVVPAARANRAHGECVVAGQQQHRFFGRPRLQPVAHVGPALRLQHGLHDLEAALRGPQVQVHDLPALAQEALFQQGAQVRGVPVELQQAEERAHGHDVLDHITLQLIAGDVAGRNGEDLDPPAFQRFGVDVAGAAVVDQQPAVLQVLAVPQDRVAVRLLLGVGVAVIVQRNENIDLGVAPRHRRLFCHHYRVVLVGAVNSRRIPALHSQDVESGPGEDPAKDVTHRHHAVAQLDTADEEFQVVDDHARDPFPSHRLTKVQASSPNPRGLHQSLKSPTSSRIIPHGHSGATPATGATARCRTGGPPPTRPPVP